MHTGFKWGKSEGRDRFESLSVNGIILKRILNDREAWTELIPLNIGTFGGLLKGVMNHRVPQDLGNIWTSR